jgi:EamA domain-containing membrane protein RarD
MSGTEKKSITGPLLCYLGCYLVWGNQPLYWSLLKSFDTMFVMCVRVVMALVFTYLYLIISGRFRELAATFKNRAVMKYLIPASVFSAATGRCLSGPSAMGTCWIQRWGTTLTHWLYFSPAYCW